MWRIDDSGSGHHILADLCYTTCSPIDGSLMWLRQLLAAPRHQRVQATMFMVVSRLCDA
jgi:hypothetical protein